MIVDDFNFSRKSWLFFIIFRVILILMMKRIYRNDYFTFLCCLVITAINLIQPIYPFEKTPYKIYV